MKKTVISICLSILFACNYKERKNAETNINILPDFDILLMDSTTVLNTKHISTGKPIIFLYFRPDCIHCQLETEALLKNINSLKKSNIYFLTSADFDDLKGFYRHYEFEKYDNIVVGKDREHSFYRVFKPSSIPFIAIYNSQKELLKVYSEEVSINNIIKTISI